ncbi:MAG: type II toxin-antitoxin system HicA family toxin [Nitrospirae bacterium]|nr:type II toxin-antitoxin system HicA family toxin [Nitrospirota bacterium]
MSILPSLTGKDIIGILKKTGFRIERQRGSHVFLRNQNGLTTVVPVHSGEIIGHGLFAKILRDVEMTKEDFLRLL